MAVALVVLSSLLICSALSQGNALSSNYYDKTCPDVESIVTNAIKKEVMLDKTVPAALLRMHFHDCFIRGCDASVLLDSSGMKAAEKAGPPNLSLHAFHVIDNVKKEVEALCPGVVSCADILALAARDVVEISGGPTWDVPKGRKDGRKSLASETTQLPAPTFNLSQLQQSFSQRGLSMEDLVALSANLKNICPIHNKKKTAGATMDPSPTTFDNTYYKLILQGKSLFSSDHALMTSSSTRNLVSKYATSKEAFYTAFIKSMIKMSSITGGQEVRKNCRKIN